MSQDSPPLEGFSGTVRLFPLPNLVLFPHVTQPLHIFEPRYRQLMADALAGDRLIAMALLCPGWEDDYQGNPPIHPVVCLGCIQQEQRLPDGRYTFLLQGLARARIREEVKADRLYRLARVDLLPEERVQGPPEKELRQRLIEKVSPFFAAQLSAKEQVRQLVESGLSLGALCDVFGFALPLEMEVKQRLLEQVRVESRVGVLLESLEGLKPPASEPTKRTFPPEFSTN
jgi:Lon protease-like protein